MARRVFFSFAYSDVWRANIVRNCWVTQGTQAAGFVDAAAFEKIKKQGDAAVHRWIDAQLKGTSVTVVLVGAKTCRRPYVQYEINKSRQIGNGLLGIDISAIPDSNNNTTTCCGLIPKGGHKFYRWYKGNGHKNIGAWIEAAARAAGR